MMHPNSELRLQWFLLFVSQLATLKMFNVVTTTRPRIDATSERAVLIVLEPKVGLDPK